MSNAPPPGADAGGRGPGGHGHVLAYTRRGEERRQFNLGGVLPETIPYYINRRWHDRRVAVAAARAPRAHVTSSGRWEFCVCGEINARNCPVHGGDFPEGLFDSGFDELSDDEDDYTGPSFHRDAGVFPRPHRRNEYSDSGVELHSATRVWGQLSDRELALLGSLRVHGLHVRGDHRAARHRRGLLTGRTGPGSAGTLRLRLARLGRPLARVVHALGVRFGMSA